MSQYTQESFNQLCFTGKLKSFEEALECIPKSFLANSDKDGRNALHWACAGGHDDIVFRLLEYPEVREHLDSTDNAAFTPLLSATAKGSVPIIKRLLHLGADVSKVNNTGASVLHLVKGRSEVLKVLLPHVSSVNIRDNLGITPLHRAAGANYFDVVRILLEHGATLDNQDEYGNTPLHYACEEGSVEAALLLIDNGGKVDIENKEGKTPIHYCGDNVRLRTSIIELLKRK